MRDPVATEREKRIRKVQAARAIARQREREPNLRGSETDSSLGNPEIEVVDLSPDVRPNVPLVEELPVVSGAGTGDCMNRRDSLGGRVKNSEMPKNDAQKSNTPNLRLTEKGRLLRVQRC